MPNSSMLLQRFVDTPSHDFMPFFALTCWTYIFLVSSVQPQNPMATFFLCIGAVLLAVSAPWLDYRLRPLYQKHATFCGLQADEEVQPPGRPSVHECECENNTNERMPLPQSRTAGDDHAPGQEGSVAGEHVQSISSDFADTLAAVHEKLVRIRQRNRETIARLAETQALFDERREKTRVLKTELTKTRFRMLLSPLQDPSLLQQRLRPTGRGLGALWTAGQV